MGASFSPSLRPVSSPRYDQVGKAAVRRPRMTCSDSTSASALSTWPRGPVGRWKSRRRMSPASRAAATATSRACFKLMEARHSSGLTRVRLRPNVRQETKSMVRGCCLMLAAIFVAPAFAQTDADDPHAACAAVGYVPAGLLGKPVALRDGTGAGQGRGQAHEAVTTASRDAQAFYDQGIAYLHSYVWIEAARSFHEALRRDPNLAMAHLGLSRAFTGLEDK